ncbi:MAG: hypothetical protein ACRDT4_00500 [Micromonosporaceae bacterium]
MKAETAALVACARERYEDALTCDAIHRFLSDVNDVPQQAWGQFEWSTRWSQDWTTAGEARLSEATRCRDQQEATGRTLFAVAALYEGTDIKAKYNIDIESDGGVLGSYLNAPGPGTVHPGGKVPGPGYAPEGYQGQLPEPDPDQPSAIGSRMRHLQLDSRYWTPELSERDGPPSELDLARKVLDNTPGKSAFKAFINKHLETISTAENLLRQFGYELDKSAVDMYDEATDAVPGIIRNRAELIAVAKNAYDEMSADMTLDNKNLDVAWSESTGAASYAKHGDNCVTYYDTIAGEVGWMHSEGKKAARTIDNLMLAYANHGYEKINNIINVLEAANDAINDTDPSDALSALKSVLTGLVSVMLESWRSANAEAQATLEINRAAGEGPELGDGEHTAKPFPGGGGVTDNRWKSRANW